MLVVAKIHRKDIHSKCLCSAEGGRWDFGGDLSTRLSRDDFPARAHVGASCLIVKQACLEQAEPLCTPCFITKALAPACINNFKVVLLARNGIYLETKFILKSQRIRWLNTFENLVMWLSSHWNASVSLSQKINLILSPIDRNSQVQLGMYFPHNLFQVPKGLEPFSLLNSAPTLTKIKNCYLHCTLRM